MSIKLTVSFFASKTLFSYLHWLIYLSHFAFKGFGILSSPFGWACWWGTEFEEEKSGQRKRRPKTAVSPRRIPTLLAHLCVAQLPRRLGLRVKLVGGSWEWNSASAGHPDLGRGQVSFWGPLFFQKPSGLAGRELGALGAWWRGGGEGGEKPGDKATGQQAAWSPAPLAKATATRPAQGRGLENCPERVFQKPNLVWPSGAAVQPTLLKGD